MNAATGTVLIDISDGSVAGAEPAAIRCPIRIVTTLSELVSNGNALTGTLVRG